MLIDETYFTGQLYIANVEEPDPDSLNYTNLKGLIERCEEQVLSFSFGVEMWMDFKEKYQQDPTALPQAYKDILEGKTYEKTINGTTQKCFWKGLLDKDKKTSLLAYYTYVVYQKDNVTQTTAFGQVKVDGKIGTQVPISSKVTKVYNEFLEMLHGGIMTGADGFTHEGNPYWNLNRGGIDYHGIFPRSGFVSLMQFLLDNAEEYPLLDKRYRMFDTFQNEFGI